MVPLLTVPVGYLHSQLLTPWLVNVPHTKGPNQLAKQGGLHPGLQALRDLASPASHAARVPPHKL